MCGICGIAFADRQCTVPVDSLRCMNETLRFRGPDAEGIHVDCGTGLGHRRLSVIDLSGGVQPMADSSGKVAVTFNGEIYNFRELRDELKTAGFQFLTTSDTEVLLLGYLHWGEAVVERLLGMFAFGIWDRDREMLLLARDRLGVKPLYWAETLRGDIVFGSQLTTVLASGMVRPRLSREAVARYITLGYVVGNDSILDGVRRLPPASLLCWRRGRKPVIRPYWNMAERWAALSAEGGNGETSRQFMPLLERAVLDRLTSDVPLGALLSGGIDSTVVVALMHRNRPQLRTFSVGFSESSFDETPWSRLAAAELGTQHYEEVARCDSPDLLLHIARHQDEPFADTSILPTHVLCRMARGHVTVALSGDGGDELLAGYVTHSADQHHRWAARVPRLAVRALQAGLDLLPENRRKLSLLYKAKQFLAGTDLDARDAHAWWRMLCNHEALGRLLGNPTGLSPSLAFEPFRAAYAEAERLSALDRMLYVDYKTYLVDDILVKVDRASMAYGLEVRSPFLDHRLVELCARMPPALKLRGKQGKFILRETAKGLVPEGVLRRGKSGFSAPVSNWLVGSWRELVHAELGAANLRSQGLLDPTQVTALVEEHESGRLDHGYLLFTLLQLTLWMGKIRPDLP